MTNHDVIKMAVCSAADLIRQDRMDEVILMVAKSDLNNTGAVYDLFCDGKGTECSCEEQCSDKAQLACIRRFLDRDVPA